MGYREDILKLMIDNGCRDVAELGVWRGELSRMLAPHCRTLTLVDPLSTGWNDYYDDSQDRYICTMGEPVKSQSELDKMYTDIVRDLPTARFLRMPSVSVDDLDGAAGFVKDGSLDLVCIDSIHLYRYCLAEIKSWLPKLRKGGIMAGDDYVPEHCAVARAVDEVFGVKPRGNTWVEVVK